MSDPTLATQQNLGDMVLHAPEDVWSKIRKALGVKTREEAAGMVEADPKARELVVGLLSGSQPQKSLAPKSRRESFATTARPESSGKSAVEF